VLIQDLFIKKIDRPINGVIKADQHDAASIWQELDEYVMTTQLTQYLRQFLDAYLAGFNSPQDAVIAARMGVWVSGFFGSGKSHFIKILSYLLESREAIDPISNVSKRASDFFTTPKITDPMLLADIQRISQSTADVILFNIDAKADSKTDRDVILRVFLRVFNEKLGFSGDAPHIANLERHLVQKGAYENFKQAFLESNGKSWDKQRDAVSYYRDDVIVALSKSLGMSEESAGQWFDKADEHFKINIESFAELVNDYLQTKPPQHRVVFLVDEVGQFIGDNTQLMLNLQTITEQLGTACHGRAWVIVTSQEDIDAAIGESNKSRSQDFSKIQGRFHTRLSLASSNTDEVIGKRLLAKTDEAQKKLEKVFAEQGAIINNQLSFTTEGVTLRSYRTAQEYAGFYPFAPYQFTLLSKIFEAIRRHGATGRHLSKGERSLLDAFQTAVKAIMRDGIDRLVPLYAFYPSIDSFLDSTVKNTIDNANRDVGSVFEAFDIQLLKTLFLIKYIPEIVKGSVDNLATLSIDEIDADKLLLKRKIQESLTRLEKQNLVSRNGDDWMFLTNEEQDIAREIGHEIVSPDAQIRKLMELVFDEVWKGQTKVRHRETKGDYEFNRLLDGRLHRNSTHELSVELITEFNDHYAMFTDAYCRTYSTSNLGRAILKLDDSEQLNVELTQFLKIAQYIDDKRDNAGAAGKKILDLKKDENREREIRIKILLERLIVESTVYALGDQVAIKGASSSTILDETVNYLVSNTYSKLNQLKPMVNAYDEIRAVLTTDEVQHTLLSQGDTPNAQALHEVVSYLLLKASVSAITLDEVVKRFSGIPYGWKPEWEIVLLVARAFMAGEITLFMDGTPLAPKAAVEPLTKTARFRNVSILKRKKTNAIDLKKAQDLYKNLFSSLAPDDEDGLVKAFQTKLGEWHTQYDIYHGLSRKEHFPGESQIQALLDRLRKQRAIKDSATFIDEMLKASNDWRDAEEQQQDLVGFYKENGQQVIWTHLLKTLRQIDDNRDALNEDATTASALRELEAIRSNPAPYNLIPQIEGLLATVEQQNQKIVAEHRQAALAEVNKRVATVNAELDQSHAEAPLRNRALLKLRDLERKLGEENSLSKLFFLKKQADELMDEAVDLIAQAHAAELAAQQKVVAAKAASQTAVNSSTKAYQATPSVVAPVQPAPKPPRAIRAASFAQGGYMETPEQVEIYLDSLRTELLKAIAAGHRVRIE